MRKRKNRVFLGIRYLALGISEMVSADADKVFGI